MPLCRSIWCLSHSLTCRTSPTPTQKYLLGRHFSTLCSGVLVLCRPVLSGGLWHCDALFSLLNLHRLSPVQKVPGQLLNWRKAKSYQVHVFLFTVLCSSYYLFQTTISTYFAVYITYCRSPTVSPPPESLPYPLLHCEVRVPLRLTTCTRFTSPVTELSST